MFKHVLVALTAPVMPKATLMTAAVLSNEQNAELTVLCISAERNNSLHRIIEGALAIVGEFGSSASPRIARGKNVEALVKKAAAALNADLIIMATSRTQAIAPALFAESDVPVLCVNESFAPLKLKF